MAKKKYYVVWSGRRRGIFTNWKECEAQIKGFPGAKYKSFKTWDAAKEAYDGQYADFVGGKDKKPKLTQAELAMAGTPVVPSISVDAACSGNPGIMEYQGVDTESKEQLFHCGPFYHGTNNIGEFLGLVDGLRMLQDKGSRLPIYTDSRTAMAWVRNRKVNTTLERIPENEELFDLVEDALDWLQNNEYSTKIIKWNTEVWGEIPADFGRK